MATYNSKFSIGQNVAWFMNRGIENPSQSLKTGAITQVSFSSSGTTYAVSGIGTSTDHLHESEVYATVQDAWDAAERMFVARVESLERQLDEANAKVEECRVQPPKEGDSE